MKPIFITWIAVVCVLFGTAQTVSVKHLASYNNIPPDSRSVSVNMTCNTPYQAGATMQLWFTLDLTSPDLEYADSVWMSFPAGFTVLSGSDPITNATEGQGAETLNLPIGSPTISWGDNDNSWGGIETGIHTFFVEVSIAANVSGSQWVQWHVDGDELGAAPHWATGNCLLSPLPPTANIQLTAQWDLPYRQVPFFIPFAVQPKAAIFNSGNDLTSAETAFFSGPSLGVGSQVNLPNPFANGQQDTLIGTVFSSGTVIGNHVLRIAVPYALDYDSTDNSDSLYLQVTDSTLSVMDTLTNGVISIGDGATGILGSVFEIPSHQTLSSVSFYSPNGATSQASMVLFGVDPQTGIPDTLLWETDTIPLHPNDGPIYTFPLAYPISAQTPIFIGVREQATGSINMGRHTIGYSPNTHFAAFQGQWVPLGQIGFPFSLSLQLHFSQIDSCAAHFSFAPDSMANLGIQFTNHSTHNGGGGMAYQWDFGDGDTSHSMHPMHQFSVPDTFTVCLIASTALCTDTNCQEIIVTDTINSVKARRWQRVKVFPNPGNKFIGITGEEVQKVRIFAITGQQMYASEHIAGEIRVATNSWPVGTYLVRFTLKDGMVKNVIWIKGT